LVGRRWGVGVADVPAERRAEEGNVNTACAFGVPPCKEKILMHLHLSKTVATWRAASFSIRPAFPLRVNSFQTRIQWIEDLRAVAFPHGQTAGLCGMAHLHPRKCPTVGAGSSQREDSPARRHHQRIPCRGVCSDMAFRVAVLCPPRRSGGLRGVFLQASFAVPFYLFFRYFCPAVCGRSGAVGGG